MSPAPVWEAVIRLAASDVLNLNDRNHWSKAASKRRTIRQLAEQTARFSHAPSLERARLVVEIAFPDGLVDAGVLPDDDAKHLLGPDLRRHPEVTKKRLAQPVYEFHLSLYDRGGIS